LPSAELLAEWLPSVADFLSLMAEAVNEPGYLIAYCHWHRPSELRAYYDHLRKRSIDLVPQSDLHESLGLGSHALYELNPRMRGPHRVRSFRLVGRSGIAHSSPGSLPSIFDRRLGPLSSSKSS
jgi:hypothetical protein